MSSMSPARSNEVQVGRQFPKRLDPEIFVNIAESVYRQNFDAIVFPFDFRDCLHVFARFFTAYERYAGKSHPPIKREQIRNIIDKMPYLSDEDRSAETVLEPSDYDALIEAYFQTQYQAGCNYRLNHFFSGNVRKFLYYKHLY